MATTTPTTPNDNDHQERGNTKLSPGARRWCFTLNNWTEEELTTITTYLKNKKYIIGKEVGAEGTPHLQGYFSNKTAVTLKTLKNINTRWHLEKARGNEKQNFEYCSKEGDFSTNIEIKQSAEELQKTEIDRILKLRYRNITWKPWQEEILRTIESQPDERKINWYWEKTGNTGKSFLCKYIACKFKGVIICTGKRNDVFNQINTSINCNEIPKIILIDVPRSCQDFINYGTIEEIKNGLIYSGKYEGGKCIFDYPHVICLANELPDMSKLSKDRWMIKNIDESLDTPVDEFGWCADGGI